MVGKIVNPDVHSMIYSSSFSHDVAHFMFSGMIVFCSSLI